MRDWDAATYDRVSDPQVAWAERLLERLPLHGDETVLDAGCGSGRVTRMLLDRLPHGRVVAVDASLSMVEHARSAIGERATVLMGDLTDLRLEERVDGVFSNAVFHWVADHDTLFERIFEVLRPGGWLLAQCGGRGNVERFHAAARAAAAEPPFARHLGDWRGPWNFAGPEETSDRLRRTGFTDIETWLEPSHVRPDWPAGYLRSVCLGYHVERLPEDLRDRYVAAVEERLGPDVELDYVRLNIRARRP